MNRMMFLLPILFLSACGSKELITVTDIINKPKLNPNMPESMKLDTIQWQLLDQDDFKELTKDSKKFHYFVLTPAEAEKLGKNQVEQQRYILQLRETVIYYRDQNLEEK